MKYTYNYFNLNHSQKILFIEIYSSSYYYKLKKSTSISLVQAIKIARLFNLQYTDIFLNEF
jgi:DNA-binding XRE family transcriptional regulator